MSVGARQASARIAAKSAVKIRAALAGSIDARRVYTQYMDTQPPITANKAQDRARARAWAMNNVKLDLEAYKKALRTHYAAMYVLGQREALENMATAAKAQKGPVATVNSKPKTNAQGMPIFDPNFSINWDAWTPGNETAAALLDEPGGLKKLLGDIDIQARGIADYSHDLLGTALADGIARGDTPVTIANDIRDSLSAPERALTIAITEGQRAKISANLDSYQANNVEQIEWTVNDPDDADCLDNEGEIVNMGDQFPSGDTQPPVHPNCQCDVIPVMPDLSGTPDYTDNTDNTDDSEMAVRADLEKYNENQERDSHGRFGSGGGATGGNGLNHREIYNLQINRSDPQQKAVYKAEQAHHPEITQDLPQPQPPSVEMYRKGEMTRAEYDKAYKEYSKNFNEWSKESSRDIRSPLGEKNLNGTPKGSQAYVNEVTSQPWFIEKFGNGGVVGTPKVSFTKAQNIGGTYVLGFKRGEPYSGLFINRAYSLNEPTFVHELAHYATAISQTTPFDGHGVEFASNHVYIASQVMGSEYGAGLAQAYQEAGVKIG